jgi:uncharacterized protein involved in exopolysaccharide biosynthesis
MNHVADDDVMQLLADLWRGKRWIAACTVAALLVSGGYAFLATPIYRAEALVQMREEQRGGSLGTLAVQLGGLADAAGIAMGGAGDTAVAMATLKSRILIEPFLVQGEVLRKLYKNKWNAKEGRWKSDDPSEVPTTWEAYNKFTREALSVVEDKRTGLVTVAIEWEDPNEAQRWVSELITQANAHLRERAIREGEANLAYLQEQTGKIGQVELRRSLYGLVESELKKLMVARGSEEFAMRTIDPAVVPTKTVRPKRLLIVVVGALGGMFIGATIALLHRELLKKSASR